MSLEQPLGRIATPSPAAVLELLKPITWFPPMWAFACGLVSTPAPVLAHWPLALGGLLLADLSQFEDVRKELEAESARKTRPRK